MSHAFSPFKWGLFGFMCLFLAGLAACSVHKEPVGPAPMDDAQLISILAGRLWVAESIHGRPVIDMSHTAMVFTTNGVVNGSGGCNAFTGNYALENGVITFPPLAVTMKMCAPALNTQEAAFIQSLKEPQKVSFSRGLLLFTPDNGAPSVFAVQNLE